MEFILLQWPFPIGTPNRMSFPDEKLEELKAAARHVSKFAYCRYSGFAVGAAVLTYSGRIFSGCNVENVSFGLTICAERNAIFQAVAAGETAVNRVVVYTPTTTPSSPCGACRQVIWEFGAKALIYCFCDGSDIIVAPIVELLGHAFGPRNLSTCNPNGE
jgi:cytidine deaminase